MENSKTTNKKTQFTAIYDTAALRNIEYCFQAANLTAAIRFCHYKFSAKQITLVNDETGHRYQVSNAR